MLRLPVRAEARSGATIMEMPTSDEWRRFLSFESERAGVRYESSWRVYYRTIWGNGDGSVGIIDQTRLPHAFETLTLTTLA